MIMNLGLNLDLKAHFLHGIEFLGVLKYFITVVKIEETMVKIHKWTLVGKKSFEISTLYFFPPLTF